jgi:hypothetical protein
MGEILIVLVMSVENRQITAPCTPIETPPLVNERLLVPDSPIVQIYDYFEPDQTGALFRSLLKDEGIKTVNICLISGRCGSTYLGHLGGSVGLNSTLAQETFHELTAKVFAKAFPERDLAVYLRLVIDRCRAGDRFFFQATPYRLQAAGQLFGLENILASCDCFSVIFRRNILSQALSYEEAASTGVWHNRGQDAAQQSRITDPRNVLPWLEMINNIEIETQSLLGTFAYQTYYYEDIASQPMETLLAYLNQHDYPVSLDRLQAAFSTKDSPKKLLKPDFARSYLSCLEEFPWISAILQRRTNGDLCNQEIARRIHIERFGEPPESVSNAGTQAVNPALPAVENRGVKSLMTHSGSRLRRLFGI